MDTIPAPYDPFGAGEITRLSPTTEPQREIIAAAMMSPEANTAYNEAVSVRIRGIVSPELLESALRTLVERHDALRTTFTPQLDVLCVTAGSDFVLQRMTVVAADEVEREARVQQLWREVATTPMSLFEGPLFQARLLQFGVHDAELVLLAHHAVCDGWSFHVLLQELSALCGETAQPLPPASLFSAFAERQSQLEQQHADANYWLRRFADKPAALDLPTDRPRPARRTFCAHRVDHRFASSTTKLMTSAAGRMRASALNVLLGGVSALLHRLTDANDVTLGMPVARQALDELPNLVGHCVQLLPVRVAVEEAMRFEQVVAAAKTAVLDASEHFDFTFNNLVRELGLSGDAARVPLIPVLVNIDQALAPVKLGEAQGTVRTVPRTAEAFEIFFNVMPDAAGWAIETTFNSDLFADETIAAWLKALENLLIAGCTDPAAPVRSLQVAANAEAGFAATERALDYEVWLEPFLRLAAARPTATAVIDADGETSFGELARRAAGLARELARLGVQRGDIVGLCSTRTRDLLVSMAGIHLVGAAYVPLDPDFPEARLRFQLEDTAAKLVVTNIPSAPVLATLGVATIDPGSATEASPTDCVLPKPGDLAYVLYTSGSTGKPKGVRVQHRPLANLLASVVARPGFSPNDTLLAITTIAFDISLLELLVPMVVGGRLVVARRGDAEDPQALANLIVRHDVTVMQATPATWQLLLEDGWAGRSTLRAFCGGERLRPDLAAALLPRVQSLWNLYGPTETCVWSAGAEVVASETASLVGTPFDNTRIVVLDRSGVVLPPGMPGEVCIGGAGLAQGYQNLPQLTAERFVDHLQLGRLYRTGDRGRIRPTGVLECLGRMDQQVKVRGFRIELGEIESALGSHDRVIEAAVLLDEASSGGGRLVAYVASRAPAPTTTMLRDHLRATLPEYMVPQQFVLLPALPRLPNGKLDRRSLPRVSAADQQESPTAVAEPTNATERIVRDAMSEVLGVSRLGIDHGFFDVGGHSLLAAQLVARLNRACNVQMTMRTVFEAPTARQLASLITSGTSGRTGATPIERRGDQGLAPVTHQQERIWYMHQMMPNWPTYNLPSAHRLRGPFDVAAFHRALQTVVDRQASLRTTFERRGNRLWQIVQDAYTIELAPAVDLSGLPIDERERKLLEILNEQTSEPFDLARLPLFRAKLFRLAADEHVFFFMPHHIVWDGWSFDVLYEEMSALYGAFAAGRSNPLPDLPISYGDFAAWHRETLTGDDAKRQAAWWRERLVRFGRVQPLPTDGKRSQGMSGAGATEHVAVDVERTNALHQLGRDHGATLFLTTLAIYGVLLHDYSGTTRMLLATPIRGRESADLESIAGCCNSLLPLPIEVLPTDTFADLLRRTKASVLESLANPDVVLEQLASAHQTANGTTGGKAGGVLYQALFSFQDVRRRSQQWGRLDHSMIHVFQKGATEDLGLWFVEGGNGLQGGLTHNTRVLSSSTAGRLRDRFLEIVDEVIRAPDVPIARLVGRLQRIAANVDVAAPIAEPLAPPRDLHQGPQRDGANKETIRDFEFILTQIWRQVLGVQEINVHDDFFHLGGNSLGAIRCVTEFESATNIRLDLGELFRTPTIAALARSVGNGMPRGASMLIPLHTGGGGSPVFCLLGIQVYRHFASALGDSHPVFGVYVREEQALVGRPVHGELPLASIDQLAGSYVDLITSANPMGPLHLAGLSLGGVVAMEVARRLTERGVQVQSVFLLDTILPSGYRRTWLRRLRDSALGDIIAQMVVRLGLRKRPMLEQELAVGERLSREAMRHYAAAMDREVARWQAGYPRPSWRVVLLRAKDNTAWGRGIVFEPDLGWRRMVGDRLTVVEVDGDHVGMLVPPQVKELVARGVSLDSGKSGGLQEGVPHGLPAV